jgi:predicted HD superfamily hydrolase involved in NAD metabolism
LTGREITELESKALDYIGREIPGLKDHLLGTRDFALEISVLQYLDLDTEKIALAALCHDLGRLYKPDDIPGELQRRGIDPDAAGCVAPILLHGELSAELAREEIGITDEDVLRAVRIHATGAEEMSVLDKLIYLADKIEPTRDYPGVEELREMARKDLFSAFPEVISAVIQWVVAGKLPLDYNSVAAYNRAVKEMESP